MKIILATFIITLSLISTVSAYTNTVNKNLSGFYLGLHGGYEFTKGKIRDTIINTQNNQVDLIATHNKSINLKDLSGGLHLGYQYDFGKYLAGIELSSTFNKAHKNTISGVKYDRARNLSLANIKIKHKNSYGSALRLGYKIMPQWVAGIRLGYARNRYDIQYVNSIQGIPRDGQPAKQKVNYNSFVPGIYVEKLINNHLLIGAEYNYTINKKKTFKSSYTLIPAGTFAPGDEAVNNSTTLSFKPRTHDIKVRLGYKF